MARSPTLSEPLATLAKAMPAGNGGTDKRLPWVDYAKGWCIILVVMMHSALGVGFAIGEVGWLHAIVAFARPFRMPDFFLVAGLFASRAIDLPWRIFLDRRVIHFLYFYALWLLIILAVKAPALNISAPVSFMEAYAWSFIQPFSSMWFIYILPLLFVTARLMRRMPPALIFAFAVVLHLLAASFPDGGIYAMGSDMTGSIVVDSYALYLLFFLVGHIARDSIFIFAEWASDNPLRTLAGISGWAALEQAGVVWGLASIPGLTILFGVAGAFAVVAVSSLLARAGWLRWLAYCGRHSLVIYLAFVVPMALTRTLLVGAGVIASAGWISLAVTAAAVAAPLALEAAFRNTPLRFLFTRPRWARLGGLAHTTGTRADYQTEEP